jgi:hypothetical protein
MKPWQRFGLAVAVMVCSGATSAAPCAGFTDVDSLDAFCPNVEWLRNRAITLGCTSTSVFCPSNSVTRLQMAAFMNRLGTALTPIYLTVTDTDTGNLGPGLRICETGDQIFPDFPRLVVADAVTEVSASATDQVVNSVVTFSTNGGMTWSQPASIGVSMRVAPVGNIILPMQGIPLPLNVGTPYRFSVFVSTNSGPPGTAVASCNLRLRFENRNGAASPF